jgi:hypothetical protein
MLVLNKTYEIHCNRDADNPTKEVAWYLLVKYHSHYELIQAWKKGKYKKSNGYRKVVVTSNMEVLK